MTPVSSDCIRSGLDATVRLIEAEFREMPGMRLTHAQMERLWHLSPRECDDAIDLLRRAGWFVKDAAGRVLALVLTTDSG